MTAPGNGTFVYSPDIRVIIEDRQGGGQIDVSADIEDFRLTRAVSAISSFSCTLSNKNKKYDRRIYRMARISVFLKRTRWLQVFSGYTDTVPFETVVPGSVTLEASCTLKILENSYWDSHTVEAQALLPGMNATAGGAGNKTGDGGAAQGMFNVLTQVVHWDHQKVHVQKIPQAFVEFSERISHGQNPAPVNYTVLQDINDHLGSGGVTNGGQPGQSVDAPPTYQGAQTYQLPATTGRASWFGGRGGGAYGHFALTGELGGKRGFPADGSGEWSRGPYFCAMRWRPKGNVACYNYWKSQKLLVTSVNRPDQMVVVYPADWGPSGSVADNPKYGDTGYTIDLGRAAYDVISARGAGDEVTIKMVDPSTPTGPVLPGQYHPSTANTTQGSNTTAGQKIKFAAGVKTKGRPSPATPGISALQPGTWGMIYWLDDLCNRSGVDYTITSAYRETNVRTNDRISNHWRGLAIDVSASQAGMDKLYNLLTEYAGKGVFRELIYQHNIWNATGTKRRYNYKDHFDHIHMSTVNTTEFLGWTANSVGQPGSAASDTAQTVTEDGLILNNFQSPFTIIWHAYTTPNEETTYFTGKRAFINDEKVLATMQWLCKSSLREFQSAPNGDFVAWFPDWFGIWGKTPVMVLRDIELKDFKLNISDKPLATHVAVAGSSLDQDTSVSWLEWLYSWGIVTIENPEIMRVLLGFAATDDIQIDSASFMQTYGMRPKREEMGVIRNHKWEFLYALFVFLKQWSLQYATPVDLTFMPEMYPGMRVMLPESEHHGALEVYVEGVSHTGSRTGGFSTQIEVSCPVRDGLPLGLDLTVVKK